MNRVRVKQLSILISLAFAGFHSGYPAGAALASAAESESLQVSTGQAKVNSLLQAWVTSDSTSSTGKTNFRLRRAEIKLSGSVVENTRWFVMIDPSKSLSISSSGTLSPSNDNKVLQDLGVAYGFTDQLELILGQMKILTSAESLDPSSELLMPERSLVARTYGDQRQPGAQLNFKEKTWKAGVMLANGGKANTDDTDVAKDFSLRVEGNPITHFGLGGFVRANDTDFSGNLKWGVNARWTGEAAVIRAEYVKGKDTTAGIETDSRGYVAEAGYTFGSGTANAIQPVIRYDRVTPNTLVDYDYTTAAIGLNWLIAKNNAKMQASYGYLYNEAGNNGSYTGSSTPTGTPGRLFVLSYQMAI